MFDFSEIDPEVFLKTAGPLLTVLVTIVGAIIQVRKKLPKMRGTLKADLEILKLLKELDPTGPTSKAVEASIDLRIREMYGVGGRFSVEKHKGNLVKQITFSIVGILWIFAFGFWTYKLNAAKEGFAWWSLLTGYLTLAGVGLVMMGFQEERRSAKEKADTPDAQAAGTDS